jgi:hypothetical protein
MRFPLKQRPFRFAVGASLAALLILAAASPTVAQQADSSKTTAQADSGLQRMHVSSAAELAAPILTSLPSTTGAAQTASPSAPLRGPRLQPEIRGVEPNIAQPDALARPAAMGKNHTIVISTLAIVLIAIIVTILVVK